MSRMSFIPLTENVVFVLWGGHQYTRDHMIEIKIDRNIPLPTSGRGGVKKYPFGDMNIGDSCFIAGSTSGQMSSRVSYYRPKKFTIRTVIENGVNGVRVWRTA